MDFELVSADEGGIVIRDRVKDREWQFMIVMRDDRRELSDSVTTGQGSDGEQASIEEYPLAWRFAYDAAVARELIDTGMDE